MNANLAPHKLDGTMAFMFETREILRPTHHALSMPQRQAGYDNVWNGLDNQFAGARP